jgi:hypothetical protein
MWRVITRLITRAGLTSARTTAAPYQWTPRPLFHSDSTIVLTLIPTDENEHGSRSANRPFFALTRARSAVAFFVSRNSVPAGIMATSWRSGLSHFIHRLRDVVDIALEVEGRVYHHPIVEPLRARLHLQEVAAPDLAIDPLGTQCAGQLGLISTQSIRRLKG